MKLNNNNSNQKLFNLAKGGLTVLISVAIIFTVVKAGSLTPTSSPAATSYTLTDIYNRLNTNAAATEGNHDFTPGASPAGTLYTLTEIYNKIPTIAANTVKLGTSYLGVDGTLVPSGTATEADCLDTKTFYAGDSWTQKTGSLTTQTLSAANDTVTAGNYNATTLSTVDTDLVTSNIKSGINIFGIDGDGNVVDTSSGDAAASDILSGKIGWVDGVARTGTYDASSLAVGTVKSGTTFGVGLTGEYPSAANTLPSADATADLAASAGDITSSNGAVEWWQSDGARQTATLDFPTLSNVCPTDTSNNSAGTLTVTASTIGIGNTYCGTAGTLLADLFNGTGQGFTGGSQANGGVDDYNNAGSPPADRYSKNWTACTSGNNYCGTGLASADAKDDSTGLIWSLPCNGAGCASFADTTPLTYTWDNSGGNNNVQTASQLCSAGSHSESGWSLPHQKQLMQAYIDGSYGNLETSGLSRYYWSATTNSNGTTNAWRTTLFSGNTYYSAKTNAYDVRCVRPAP